MELNRTLWAQRRPDPSIRSDVRVIIESVSGFARDSCRETWWVPVPGPGSGCQGSSTALSRPPSKEGTKGIEHRALPEVAPEGHFAVATGFSHRPLGHPGRAAPFTPSRLHHVPTSAGPVTALRFPLPCPSFGWTGCGLEKATGLAEAAAPIIRKLKEAGQA